LPCTCNGGGGRPLKMVEVKLSTTRKLLLKTDWDEKFQYGDELITIDEFIKILFGRLPHFFSSDSDLRTQWENPTTRVALVRQLEDEGFAEEKLQMVRKALNYEKCDLLDVLEFLAYNTTPKEREERVNLVRADYYKRLNAAQQKFVDYLIERYVEQGALELTMENLPTFIKLKYGSLMDAKNQLGMDMQQISQQYIDFQKQLYSA